MTEMWAYIYTGEEVVKTRTAVPKIRKNDVLIKIEAVSICGSDFHIFANDDWAKESLSPGIVIGHEGSGIVVEVGENVQDLSVGDFVALESHFACPQCEAQGVDSDNCPHYGIIGIHGSRNGQDHHQVGGVFAEYAAIPYYCCHKLSDTIRSKVFPSLLEPAGNSWEIISFLKNRGLPHHLAIFGSGPHGLNLQLFARYAGIRNIIALELDSWRIQFAKDFGAAHQILNSLEANLNIIDQFTDKHRFDVAVDMVGNIKVVDQAKEWLCDNGLLILFGLPRHEALISHGENFSDIIFHNEEFTEHVADKQITIRGFTGRTRKTWSELLSALEESEMLRNKLSKPIEIIGSLHELEKFIKEKPKHYLKIAMTSF